MVGTEQDISGILAKEKLVEIQRQQFTKKIEDQVKNIQKSFQEGLQRVEKQVKAVATSRGDSETLKKWPSLTEAEKQVSPLIPRNAFASMLEAIFAEPENIPGLKRQVAELYTKEDAEKLLSEDPSGKQFAEAICTSESCKTKVREKVEEYQESHGQKKERGFWD
ncbi:hypothetical protein ES707_13792 [subsurface metagenome]